MNDIATAAELNAKDFTSDQEIRWCPGCGDFAIVKSVRKALAEIGFDVRMALFADENDAVRIEQRRVAADHHLEALAIVEIEPSSGIG